MEDIKINVKFKLSAAWAAMMFLYVYADILSLFRPGQLDEMLQGKMGPFEASQGTLVGASLVVIIPALMIFFSLVLKPTVNRWTNIVLGVLYIAVNIGNIVGETWAYYLLFGALELVLTLLIIRLAWKWPASE